VGLKEASEEDRDSYENIVIGWEQHQYELSHRNELYESKFLKKIICRGCQDEWQTTKRRWSQLNPKSSVHIS
jgi:hypothetical protein